MEVRQQRNRDSEPLPEGLVRVRGVDRDAVQLHTGRLQLAEDLLVHVELVGADRAEVERVEDQDRRLPAKGLERDLVAVLIPQLEVGRRGPGLDHRRRPSSPMSER